MVKIDKGFPIPKRGQRVIAVYKYPFSKMQVGDSFFTPTSRPNNMYTIAHRAAKIFNHKYTCRSVVEDEVAGVRIWRIL